MFFELGASQGFVVRLTRDPPFSHIFSDIKNFDDVHREDMLRVLAIHHVDGFVYHDTCSRSRLLSENVWSVTMNFQVNQNILCLHPRVCVCVCVCVCLCVSLSVCVIGWVCQIGWVCLYYLLYVQYL